MVLQVVTKQLTVASRPLKDMDCREDACIRCQRNSGRAEMTRQCPGVHEQPWPPRKWSERERNNMKEPGRWPGSS